MTILDVNKTARLSGNTRYHTLRVYPTQRCLAYTYNGLSRCPRCLCLQSNPEAHKRVCKGRLPVRMHGHPCENRCGLLFSTPYQARRHAGSCEGLIIESDRYNTLVCPKCNVAGFSHSVISRHVRHCSGSRAQTLASYSNRQVVHRCGGCGDHFFWNALCTHACHVFGDPLWLGESAPPDTTVSYVRWCRERSLTLGGCPGSMPDAVRDTSISIPSPPGAPGFCADAMPEQDDFSDDADSDSDCCSSDEACDHGVGGGAGVGDAGAEGVEEEGWGQEVGEQGGHDAGDVVHTQRHMLAAAGITFSAFEPAACRGIVWRHGFFPCPFSSTITVDNARLRRLTIDGQTLIQIDSFCRRCASTKARIKKWIREGKYTPEGLQVCRRTSCREPAISLWYCRRHADLVTAHYRSRGFRRVKVRTATPGEMAAFLASLQPRILVSPAWRSVRDAVRGGQHQGAAVFFLDTESVYDRLERKFLVCQLGVRSASSGDLLLFTLVDHRLSFRQLRERVDPRMWPKLARLYSFAGLDADTHGMTASQVTDRLVQLGMSATSHLVEWSLNGFDLRALQATFGASVFPKTALLGHELWRSLGLRGSVALEPLFHSHQPLSPLNRRHHEADVDAMKLYIMVKRALECFS